MTHEDLLFEMFLTNATSHDTSGPKLDSPPYVGPQVVFRVVLHDN